MAVVDSLQAAVPGDSLRQLREASGLTDLGQLGSRSCSQSAGCVELRAV